MTPVLLMLGDAAAKGTAVLGAAWLLARVLPPKHAVFAMRCAAVIALAMPAVVLLAGARPAMIHLPAPVANSAQGTAVSASALPAPIPYPTYWAELDTALFGLWLLGAVFVASRYFVSLGILALRFARGRDLAIGRRDVHRRVAVALYPGARVGIRVAPGVTAPCTFGWRRPKILLPQDIETSALSPVLAHELCHARNRDAVWLMALQMVCALYWFNPLAWLTASCHRDSTEAICDEDAVRSGVDVEDYVGALLSVARRPVPAAAAGAYAKHLSTRIRQLIERDKPMPEITVAVRGAVIAATALVALLCTDGRLIASTEAAHHTLHRPIRTALEPVLHPLAGQAILYIQADQAVTVSSGKLGLVCVGGGCQFTVPAGRDIVLNGSPEGGIAWSGCTPRNDGRTCVLRIDGADARVEAWAK